jgi:hypothetical protein
MRILSSVELDHIAGGDGSTVYVPGSNIGGTSGTPGADYSAYTAETFTPGEASGPNTITLTTAAIEVLACRKAYEAAVKNPTIVNGISTATLCSKALNDAIIALGDWGKANPDFVKAMTVKPVP